MTPIAAIDPAAPHGGGGAAANRFEQGMSDETLRMLELSHRTKNILSIVQALVNQTLRGDAPMDEARRSLSNRLVAMGNAVDALMQTAWQPASLEEIVRGGLIHSTSFEGRVHVSGPAVPVGAGAAMSLSLVLHELESNAIKYGALSNRAGSVDLRWSLSDGSAGPILLMEWREQGGPSVRPPTHHGFGTRLIGSGISRRLGGKANCRFDPGGLHWTLSAPLAELAN